METVKLDEMREFSEEKLVKKQPLKTDKVVYNAFFLKPFQILPFHRHPATDEVFHIIEGQGEFTVGSEQKIVSAGATVYGPAATFHGIINSGQKELVMISVQAPKPVKTEFKENATVICPVCKQELIVKDNADAGDEMTCARCGAHLLLMPNEKGGFTAQQA